MMSWSFDGSVGSMSSGGTGLRSRIPEKITAAVGPRNGGAPTAML